jgi:hypothetical protein
MPRPTLVKLPSLARIETGGETRPSMARKLAEALGVEVDDLLHQPPDG